MTHQNDMTFLSVQMVPPPDVAPEFEEAKKLGILPCLKVHDEYGQYRCSVCHEMQPNGSPIVWVPDRINLRDPKWAVVEACRENAFNGHASGWCVECARKLGRGKETASSPTTSADHSAEDDGFIYGLVIGMGVVTGLVLFVWLTMGALHG